MRPDLITLGPVTIHSFGLMAALALVVPGVILHIDLRQRGLDAAWATPIAAAAAIGGFVGARAYYLIEHGTSGGIISGTGLTWYGGVAGGALGVVLIARMRRMPLGLVANLVAPGLALALALGRIGCQLAGDGDYGTPTTLPWGMSYPDGTVPTTRLVHPTPLYESLAMLVAFWILWRLRGRLARPWSLFGLYLVLAATTRVLVEIVRRNPAELGGLTMAQLISLALIPVGVALVGPALRASRTAAVASGGA